MSERAVVSLRRYVTDLQLRRRKKTIETRARPGEKEGTPPATEPELNSFMELRADEASLVDS